MPSLNPEWSRRMAALMQAPCWSKVAMSDRMAFVRVADRAGSYGALPPNARAVFDWADAGHDLATDFDEAEHPRGPDGKWIAGEAGGFQHHEGPLASLDFRSSEKMTAALLSGLGTAKQRKQGAIGFAGDDRTQSAVKAAVMRDLGARIDAAVSKEALGKFDHAFHQSLLSCGDHMESKESVRDEYAEFAKSSNEGTHRFGQAPADISFDDWMSRWHPTVKFSALPDKFTTGEKIANFAMWHWADTSGDSDEVALAMQKAVEDEFGLKGAKDPTFRVEVEHGEDPAKKAVDVYREHSEVLRGVVRAEYDATQAWLKTNGLTSVTLYRGMNVDMATSGAFKGGGEADAMLQPQSSFSSDPRIAIGFAHSFGGGGVVMAAHVPAERVLSTCRTGCGCLFEGEAKVLGGRLPAFVVSKETLDRPIGMVDGDQFASSKALKDYKDSNPGSGNALAIYRLEHLYNTPKGWTTKG